MTTFGWSWEYVDEEMTLPRLYAIWKQWKRSPPMHVMIAAYLGHLKPEADSTNQPTGPLDSMFDAMSGQLA